MKIGCCVNVTEKDKILACKDAGADYIETSLASLHSMSKEEIKSVVHLLRDNNLSLETFNGMYPGDIRLTGEWVDFNEIEQYIMEALEKASVFCPQVMVFGSGAARQVPEGFSKNIALNQLAEVLREHMNPIFAQYGVTCAIEPLNYSECNIINTVAEGDALKQAAHAPQIKLLADIYHMMKNGEDLNDLKKLSEPPVHIHIAARDRSCPHPGDGTDYASVFSVLKEIGYTGRISIEANVGEPFEETIRTGISYLRSFL